MGGNPSMRFRALVPTFAAARRVHDESALSSQQRAILSDVSDGGMLAVWGGPRCGKTTVALAACARAMTQGAGTHDVIVVAPTRARAATLREALMAYASQRASHGLTPGNVPTVATPTALAFALVSAHESEQGRPAPALVTGADHDALLAHIISARGNEWDGIVPPESLVLPGFRTELRDVMARAAERGLWPDDVAGMAHSHAHPAWRPVARAYELYEQALRLSSTSAMEAPLRLDGGQLMGAALDALTSGPTPWRPQLLVVDDAHDLTAGGVRLVSALAGAAQSALITSAPDAAVETFRGGLPDAASRIIASVERDDSRTRVRRRSLEGVLGVEPSLAAAVGHVRERLPLSGASAQTRRAPVSEPGPTESAPLSPLGTRVASDAEGEARAIATIIRACGAHDDVSFDDIAVVCRSSGAARDLADRLSRQGLDAEATALARPLRDEPVVRDLFTLIELAHGAPLADEALVGLMRGPFGDVDDLRIRSIRRMLLRSDDARDSTALISEAFASEVSIVPAHSDDRGDRAARAILAPLERLRRMRRAATEASEQGAGIQATIWALWEASGLAQPWQDAALNRVSVSDRDRSRVMNARIDAINALLTAADRYEEREGGEDLDVFMARVRAGAVPEDSLTARARMGGKVRVMTPAAVAGLEFNTVILAGVNEGAWPNVRIRSTMLGAADLALACDFPDAPTDPQAVRRIQRETVIADEIRMAVTALSRARHRVCVTAVEGGGVHPSALFTLIDSLVDGPAWTDRFLAHETPGPFPDARTLVGSLRRAYEDGDDATRDHVSLLLDRLSEAGITEADPNTWYHQEPSTVAPVVDADAALSLSPSALETAQECPRAFLLERAGGERGTRDAQSLGTLVHQIAQEHPTAGATELIAAYVELVGQPGLDATWRERAEFDRALAIFDRLGAYQQAHQDVREVEYPFSAQLGQVRLRGSIDRIETDPADPEAVHVVDYKTSATAVSGAAAERHLQLGAYQYALSSSTDFPRVNGASLVFVGTDAKNAAIRGQAPASEVDDPDWFESAVAEIEATVRAPRVTLVPNNHCGVCSVKSSCPLYAEGTQL